MKLGFVVLLSALFFTSCKQEKRKLSASQIISKAINAHGSKKLDNATMRFSFRGIQYQVDRNNGRFDYQRTRIEIGNKIVDRLSNTSFERFQNDNLIPVSDSLSGIYGSSVNSVVYFAQLPYSLDGEAVNHSDLGTVVIKDESYHKIRVTFDEDGGGEDHEDVFIYWIDQEDLLIDYLAYSFCEEECGLRFRESVNRRNKNGVVVQDYVNYSPSGSNTQIEDLDNLFEQNQLNKVSEIKTEVVDIELRSKGN
jgi:hypothetical protein